jgi:hypothetical protein
MQRKVLFHVILAGSKVRRSVVSITDGTFGTAMKVPHAWYANGITCPSVGNCTVVGENTAEQGIVSTLVHGAIGKTKVVAGTEYLYGVGCGTTDSCVLAGASTPDAKRRRHWSSSSPARRSSRCAATACSNFGWRTACAGWWSGQELLRRSGTRSGLQSRWRSPAPCSARGRIRPEKPLWLRHWTRLAGP